jgi:hypothetical protein
MQQHRGLSNGVLAGNAGLVAQRDAKKVEVAAAVEAMIAATPKTAPALMAESQAIAKTFADLSASIDARATPVAQSFQRPHRAHRAGIASSGGGTRNPRPQLRGGSGRPFPRRHHLRAPARAHRGDGPGARAGHRDAHRTSTAARDRLFVASLFERAGERMGAARAALSKAGAIDEGLRERVQAPWNRVEGETRAVIETARRELVEAPELTYNAAEYFALTTRTIDAQFQLLEQVAGELTRVLGERATAKVRLRNVMVAGGLVLLLVVLASAFASRARSRTR